MALNNERHEWFCWEYLADLNATQAAIRAGYSARSAGSQGNRLLKNDEIRARVSELASELNGARIADATEVMEYLTKVLRGEAEGQRGRVRAAELLAKRYGLLKEQVEVKAVGLVRIIDDI